MTKLNNEMKAGTNARTITNVEVEQVCQPIAKPNVVRSFLALMYAGNFVDQSKLGSGIYSKNIPDLYNLNTTILMLEEGGKRFQKELGTKYIPDSYFDNLRKCELVLVDVVVK